MKKKDFYYKKEDFYYELCTYINSYLYLLF